MGIAVGASMYVNEDDEFSAYNGEYVLNKRCEQLDADHQVVFVGYGKKNGKNVWVLRNSWGNDWGANGNFYVEIGSDAYCIERYAFAVLGVGVDVARAATLPVPAQRLRSGATLLDEDDGGYDDVEWEEEGDDKLSPWAIAIIVVACVGAVVAVVVTFMYLKRLACFRKKKMVYVPIPMEIER